MLSDEQLAAYHSNGFIEIPHFLSQEEVTSLRQACSKLVDKMDPANHIPTIFSTGGKQARNRYFLDSGDKVRFFFEEGAINPDGGLKLPTYMALNKIGHALHWWVPEFKKLSFSSKVCDIAKSLGFRKPAVVQSMYIFKQPGYGGEVRPHKDSSFLSTMPESCVGLWFSLEKADIENGCLQFVPGSHRTPTSKRFVRNIGEESEFDDGLTKFIGTYIFQTHNYIFVNHL